MFRASKFWFRLLVINVRAYCVPHIFHFTFLMCRFLIPIGNTRGLQEGKGEGHVQEEGRCAGGALHVIKYALVDCSANTYIWYRGICFPGLENRLKFVGVTFSSLEWLDN